MGLANTTRLLECSICLKLAETFSVWSCLSRYCHDYWFDVLGFPGLRAPKVVVNTASRRISEKTGMRVIAVEERDSVSGRLLTEVWEITAQEWREQRSKKASRTQSRGPIDT